MKAYFLRRIGQPLILSDLPSLDLGKEAELELYASAPLCDIDRRFTSVVLKKEAASSIIIWIQDKRYFPRLIISALVFLAAYVLASFLIRDPVPMIDEVLIGLAAGAAAWMIVSKNDAKATVVKEKERKINMAIDQAEVIVDESLKTLEEGYEKLFSYDLSTLSHMLSKGDLPRLETSPSLQAAAECYLNTYDKGMLKDLRKLDKTGNQKKAEAEFLHQAYTSTLDLYEMAFFYQILKDA